MSIWIKHKSWLLIWIKIYVLMDIFENEITYQSMVYI